MSETKLFKKLKRATPGFHWQRHEDKLTKGIFDCSYGAKGTCGWVELKTYDTWPRKSSTPLKFSDLKPEQVNWSVARGKACKRAWFLVQIDKDNHWFLISWKYARKLGHMNKYQLLIASDISGVGPIPKSICKLFTKA